MTDNETLVSKITLLVVLMRKNEGYAMRLSRATGGHLQTKSFGFANGGTFFLDRFFHR